jgi:hypothetical protein
MTLDTPFLDGIEAILFLGRYATMAIDTFDHIKLTARSLLNTNAPFPMKQSFDRDMAVFAFDLLDLFPMMAVPAILIKGLSVIVTG